MDDLNQLADRLSGFTEKEVTKMTDHHGIDQYRGTRAVKEPSNALFNVVGKFPNGLQRKAFNLTGPEANAKMVEYRKAGATSVHMPLSKPHK